MHLIIVKVVANNDIFLNDSYTKGVWPHFCLFMDHIKYLNQTVDKVF